VARATQGAAVTTAPPAARLWQPLEHAFDAVFGAATNPLRHLGALGFLFFWWLAASGIYLFAVLDTSATTAYESIAQLSRQPWYVGGWLRSVHRYAADAFVVVLLLHLLREWLLGRYKGFRHFSWLTGVPLLLFAFGSGIVGFWLNWDRLGQYSAVATTEWLDALPLFASALTRNFISAASVSDRLFSLFIFIHVGVPLLLLFGLWFHIQRITRAAVFPPRTLALMSTLGLLALAVLAPVTSQAPADLSLVPGPLAFDWFLLFVHPLVDVSSASFVWALLVAAVLTLLGLPFLPQPTPAPVAKVDPANCHGCKRCFVDCPYAAITMVPHPDWQTPGRPIRQLARVDADLCASCGICVGACPSSTPFRSIAELVTGIDMPQQPIATLRQQLDVGLAALHAEHKLVIIGCDRGAPAAAPAGDDVLALGLICTGQLPPSFIEYALRNGAAGVLVTGCLDGDCAFRLGQRWTEERLRGAREPHLRASVPSERVARRRRPARARPRARSIAQRRWAHCRTDCRRPRPPCLNPAPPERWPGWARACCTACSRC
jgi:quinol-cytochrome oxidoreductase complex cytochrome b subunit/Pyruvate/2-oxoacid:ferredoxin oxidoreductase delta subunit